MISTGSTAISASTIGVWPTVTGRTSLDQAGAQQASPTIVSGEKLLRERLFGITDPDAKLPSYTQSSRPSTGTWAGFLNTADRAMVADLYEHAQVTGRDLGDIDALARDLGNWRSTIGPQWAPTVGSMFTMTGDPLVHLFDPSNERIAQRIAGSQALRDSGLPTDFVLRQIDPGKGAGGALGLSRLEGLLYELSPSGSARSADGGAGLPIRTPDLLSAMISDGSLQVKTAQMRKVKAENPWQSDWRMNDPRDLFERFEHRIGGLVPMLQEDDKAMLGAMYADAEDKHGVDSPELKKIDVLARKLATMRMAGMLLDQDKLKTEDERSGQPRTSLAERGQEAYDQAMREPLNVQVTYVGIPAQVDVRA
ncbi:MAG: hypothetical protein Q4G43_01905 [Mobilicoccus sp.]|nr:hypothetical protein [Mobilicoccus sp.]